MTNVKKFEDYVSRKVVKKVIIDLNRAKSFIDKAERKKQSIENRMSGEGLDEINAEDYIESCYDTIMLLIRAKMLKEGLKAVGNGGHEAEVSYLSLLGFSEGEVSFTDELRYLRNGMLYYGTVLHKEYAQKVLDFLDKIYPKLKAIVIR